MAYIATGLISVVSGFYLYSRKDRFASLAGSLLALFGLVVLIYGLVSFFVPLFFR